MDRRKFIKWGSFMTVSTASSVALTACGGGSDDSSDSSAAPPASGADSGSANPGGPSRPAAATLSFAQGVASGDPKPDSIILWTRVDGGDGTQPVNVQVQLATDAAFTSFVESTTVAAVADWDYTIRHKVTGLTPNTVYYYRFIAGSVTSMSGRTWTTPAAADAVTQLKFAVISNQNWDTNHWAGFDAMQNEDIKFIVHLGNYVYEQPGRTELLTPDRDPQHAPITLPDGTPMPDGSKYATTLADYRTLYKTYRSDARLQKLHANWPVIAIWNDHEFSDDCWQDHQVYGADDSPAPARRRSANQAWFEFMPADAPLDTTSTSFQNITIYRSFTFGTLATLVMTDERLYRADHEVAESTTGGAIGSRYLVPKSAVDLAEKSRLTAANNALTPVSMLGDTQRQWWQDQMGKATTTWKLWGNDVSLLRMQVDLFKSVVDGLTQAVLNTAPGLTPFKQNFHDTIQADLLTAIAANQVPAVFPTFNAYAAGLGFGQSDIQNTINGLVKLLPPYSLLTTVLLNADQWDGYNAERVSMMKYLSVNSIGNVVALTGDTNAFMAGTVLDDYDGTQTPVMVDLATAGVSSSSLFHSYVETMNADVDGANWLRGLVQDNGFGNMDQTLINNNAWLKYVDTNAQGYAVVELTPSQLTCSFRKLQPIDDSGAVPAAANVIAGTQVVTVAANVVDVTVVPA